MNQSHLGEHKAGQADQYCFNSQASYQIKSHQANQSASDKAAQAQNGRLSAPRQALYSKPQSPKVEGGKNGSQEKAGRER
jgi:hypothetical protein